MILVIIFFAGIILNAILYAAGAFETPRLVTLDEEEHKRIHELTAQAEAEELHNIRHGT